MRLQLLSVAVLTARSLEICQYAACLRIEHTYPSDQLRGFSSTVNSRDQSSLREEEGKISSVAALAEPDGEYTNNEEDSFLQLFGRSEVSRLKKEYKKLKKKYIKLHSKKVYKRLKYQTMIEVLRRYVQ